MQDRARIAVTAVTSVLLCGLARADRLPNLGGLGRANAIPSTGTQFGHAALQLAPGGHCVSFEFRADIKIFVCNKARPVLRASSRHLRRRRSHRSRRLRARLDGSRRLRLHLDSDGNPFLGNRSDSQGHLRTERAERHLLRRRGEDGKGAGLKIAFIQANALNSASWTDDQFLDYNTRYWEYISMRFGHVVDLWQVFNEHDASDFRNHSAIGTSSSFPPDTLIA